MRTGLQLLAIVAGGELAIMLVFAWLGGDWPMLSLALVVIDPLLLGLIVCCPIWHWVVLPVREHLDSTRDKLRLLVAAMEQSAEAVIITDRRGRIEYVNAAFGRMMGLEPASLRGRPITEFEPRMAGEEWRRGFLNCVVRQGKAWREEVREARWGRVQPHPFV